MNMSQYSKENGVTVKELKSLLIGTHHMKALSDGELKVLDNKYKSDKSDTSTKTVSATKPDWATDQQWRVFGDTIGTILGK